jgi:hypothetical protein
MRVVIADQPGSLEVGVAELRAFQSLRVHELQSAPMQLLSRKGLTHTHFDLL